MNTILERLRTTLAGLSPREQTLVGVFAALLAATLAWMIVLEPLTLGRQRLASSIGTRRAELERTRSLVTRVQTLEAMAPSGSDNKAASADFSLFAFLDKSAGASVSRERVASMTPSRRETDDGMTEITVEVKLAGVALAELVDLLRSIETSGEPVAVTRMDMRRRYDDPDAFDVTLVARTVARG